MTEVTNLERVKEHLRMTEIILPEYPKELIWSQLFMETAEGSVDFQTIGAYAEEGEYSETVGCTMKIPLSATDFQGGED
jgi:hypothetical protein